MSRLSHLWPKRLVQSFGLAVLVLFDSYSALTNPSHLLMYHAFRSTANIALPPLILLTLVTLAGFLLLQYTWKTRFWLWSGLLFAAGAMFGLFKARHLLISSLGGVQAKFHAIPALVHLYYWIERLSPLLAFVAIILVWQFSGQVDKMLRVSQGAMNLLLAAAAVFGVLNLWQIAGYAFYKPAPRKPLLAYHPAVENSPRVVWVVFDELAYSQLYESRWPGLKMPNFDALRTESDVYSNVTPAGGETEKVLPSLINGIVYDDLIYRRGQLMAQVRDTHQWQAVVPEQSIFSVAQQNGWNAAVSGWYNPYCRLYSGVLQQCSRSALDLNAGKMMLGSGVLQNLGLEVEGIPGDFLSDAEVKNHHQDAEQILAAGRQMILDGRNDFIFMHLPVPHPPNSLDRRTGKFTERAGRSYADGLAYADLVLGELMTTLKQSPRWDQTTLIINGDHTWRIGLWNSTPDWTAEDQAMSRGHESELRPALIVHAPGQTAGKLVQSRTLLMTTHDMAQQIIQAHPKTLTPSSAPAH